MQLISDSGSTKTTWAIIENGEVKDTITTAGMNPYFHTSASVEAILQAELVPFLSPDFIREIHFYGAGCSTESKNAMLKDAMKIFFRKAEIMIYHDILGAARALFGDGQGIACILGTGCNCCYYNNGAIESRVPSLGYLFGDEGAGSYLGRNFIGSYLKERLPVALKKEFDDQYRLTLEDILNSVYNRPYPNRWLASFSEFMNQRQSHPFIREMVASSFNAFFEEQVSKYDHYKVIPVSFVGSIAFFYKEILLETAEKFGINVGTIMRSPLEGLVSYHC